MTQHGYDNLDRLVSLAHKNVMNTLDAILEQVGMANYHGFNHSAIRLQMVSLRLASTLPEVRGLVC